MQKPRILVVDDVEDIREQRAELLANEGYEVETADGIDQALALFRKLPFPVVVTDLRMKGWDDGLEVAREIRTIDPETKVIIVTGTDHRQAAVDGYRVNVFAYVEKGRHGKKDSLSEAIERAFEEIREQKVKKHMLSFLAHTMRNTFAGAEPALEEVLEKSSALASKLDSDQQVYLMISNLAFLKTLLATVDSMLDAYKLLVREPENLRRAWREDQGGNSSLGEVLDTAIHAALSRLFFQEAQIPAFKRLTAGRGVTERDALTQRYLAENLLVKEMIKVSAVDWLTANFPILEVSGKSPEVSLNRSGLRFNVVFAVVSELFFNAIKYSDGRSPIKIQWKTTKGNYELRIVNSCSRESTNQVGSQKGRNFITTLLNTLDGIYVDYVETGQVEGLFEAKLAIEKELFNGENNR